MKSVFRFIFLYPVLSIALLSKKKDFSQSTVGTEGQLERLKELTIVASLICDFALHMLSLPL